MQLLVRAAAAWLSVTVAVSAMQTSSTTPKLSLENIPAAPAEKPADAKAAKADVPSKPKPIPAEELWLYPAQWISSDLESQAWRTRHDLHAIGFATLGAAWWKQDRSAAEHWIYPAVDEVTIASQDEADSDRARRLQAARRVLDVVTPFDPVLRERLKDVLQSATSRDRRDKWTTFARGQTSDALVMAAQSSEPAQFARAISDALQYGVTDVTVGAIVSLRQQLPRDAESLFGRALSEAIESGNSIEILSFVMVLTNTADPGIPESWRHQVADAYARALSNGSTLEGNERCALANQSDPWQAAGTELLQAVTATVAACISGITDPVLATDAQILERAAPQTSADYLSVASQSKSPISRYKVKLIAAEKAEKEDVESSDGGPVRALRIFDGMTAEERAVKPGEYKRLRAEEAIRAALFTIGKSGCAAGLRVVDTSPRETIFHVGVGVAEKVSGECFSSVFSTTQRQMRTNPPEDPNDYIRFLNLALRRHVNQWFMVQDILHAMDSWKEKDAKLLLPGDVVYQAAWNNLLPLPIAQELFDLGAEQLSTLARGSFRNDLLRLDFELFLVRGFLDRYGREEAKRRAEMAAESEKP